MSHLKEVRLSKKLSQNQLAELSGVKLGTIQKYEQGTKEINKAQAITVYNLAKTLNVEIEKLLELEKKDI